MSNDHIDYASPKPPGAARRSVGQWMILVVSWGVGLIVWALYAAVIGILVLRFL